MASGPPAGGRVVGGRYEIAGELGRGGMGIVWLATDRVLHREVALKEISYPLHLTDDERAALRERTLREARAAARLENPHVVAIHDVVEEDGRPWLVMEHVRSRSLQRILEEDGPFSAVQTARIGLDVLSAIEVAHAAGVVHRDVKPANVLVDDSGRACLTDFGIATTPEGDTTLTGQGAVLGSPAYMAPERAHGERPTPAVDLWSLGATLYTAVEGRTAFDREQPMATLLAVVSDDPAPMRWAGPLAPVLARLLTKDPAARMTAAEARLALSAVADGNAAGTPPAQTPPAETPPAGTPSAASRRAARAPRGGDVERFDVSELVALASSSRAALGTVVHDVRDHARESRQRRLAGLPPPSRKARRAAAKRRRFRFKRRWVVVPAVFLLLVVALAVTGLALLLGGTVQLP